MLTYARLADAQRGQAPQADETRQADALARCRSARVDRGGRAAARVLVLAAGERGLPVRGEVKTRNGFWQMEHEGLEAILQRHDLCGEELRVYFALGDQTRGYHKERDEVAVSTIAGIAGVSQRNAHRALRGLEMKQLAGSHKGREASCRWIVWPAPSEGGVGSVNGGVPADTGASVGADTAVGVGVDTHQEGKKTKTPRRDGFSSPRDNAQAKGDGPKWESLRSVIENVNGLLGEGQKIDFNLAVRALVKRGYNVEKARKALCVLQGDLLNDK